MTQTTLGENEQVESSQPLMNYSDTPESWDWVEKGAVTRVDDQKTCSKGMYAFVSTGVVEGAYYVKNQKLVELADQQMLDCSSNPFFKNNGCSDGLVVNGLNYVSNSNTKSFCRVEDYPLTLDVKDCQVENKN